MISETSKRYRISHGSSAAALWPPALSLRKTSPRYAEDAISTEKVRRVQLSLPTKCPNDCSLRPYSDTGARLFVHVTVSSPRLKHREYLTLTETCLDKVRLALTNTEHDAGTKEERLTF